MGLKILNLRGASGPQPPFPQPNVVPDAQPVDPPFQPPFRPTPVDDGPYPPPDHGWSRTKNVTVFAGVLIAVLLIVFAAYRLGGGTGARAARLFGQAESSQEPETTPDKEQARESRVVSDSDHGEGVLRYVAGETRKQRDDRIERESREEVYARRQAWIDYLANETDEQREERIRLEEQGVRGQSVQPRQQQQQQEQPRDQRQAQPSPQDSRQAQPQGRSAEQVELIPRR